MRDAAVVESGPVEEVLERPSTDYARGLVGADRPVLLLADEATSRLDLLTQQVTVEALMGQVVEDGCGLLVVSHDEALAAALTEHRITLGDVPRR